ncbi:10524_t:CDS:2, partial [Acaulospora morrowiae]
FDGWVLLELSIGWEYLFHLTFFTLDVLAVVDLGIYICKYNRASILFAILAWLATAVENVALSLYCYKAPRANVINIGAWILIV